MRSRGWLALLVAVGALTAIWAAARLALLDQPEPTDASQWTAATCAIDQVAARFPEASYVAKKGRSRDSGQFGVRVTYRYPAAGGGERTGDRFCTVEGLCKSADDVRAARALRPGRKVPCWLSRSDPGRSALRLATSGEVRSARKSPLALGVLGGLAAAVGLVALLRRRRPKGPVPVAEVVHTDDSPPDPDPKNLV